MEFNKYQLLYIQTMYDYFRENLQWPTFRQVEKKILPTHRDFRVLDVARSFEDNQATHFFYHHLEVPATITLKEIRHYPEAEKDLADLAKVIRYCADKYINSDEDQVTVTGEEVGRNLHFDEIAVRKVGPLLVMTSGIFTSFSNPEQSIWHLTASQDVLYVEGIQSIDDYLERLDERIKSYQASRSSQNADSTISQHYDTSASIMKKRIAPEVINAISDPKIKQICIELNSTPEQNVISLMQGLGEALKWTLNYRAKQVPGASSIPRKKIGDLGPLLDDAINVPYYSDNASNRFLEVFRNYFLKAFYDAVRHDAAFIPDLVVINNAVAGLEYLLRATFP